jgi:hypothetical protein
MRTTRLSWALLLASALAVMVVIGTLDTKVSAPSGGDERRFMPQSTGSVGPARRVRPPFGAPFEMPDPARMILYTSPSVSTPTIHKPIQKQ